MPHFAILLLVLQILARKSGKGKVSIRSRKCKGAITLKWSLLKNKNKQIKGHCKNYLVFRFFSQWGKKRGRSMLAMSVLKQK